MRIYGKREKWTLAFISVTELEIWGQTWFWSISRYLCPLTLTFWSFSVNQNTLTTFELNSTDKVHLVWNIMYILTLLSKNIKMIITSIFVILITYFFPPNKTYATWLQIHFLEVFDQTPPSGWKNPKTYHTSTETPCRWAITSAESQTELDLRRPLLLTV